MEQPLIHLNVDGVPNLRGFGGYPSLANGHQPTRKGKLFRSAHPGAMTEKGLRQLKELGVTCIIDLTCHDERTIPYELPLQRLLREGIQVLHRPIDDESFTVEKLLLKYDTFREQGTKVVSLAYLDLLERGSATIRDIILILKGNSVGATLIHCSLGKDRTGLIFMLLLLLMEVPDDIIAKEYCLSTPGLESSLGIIERFLMDKGTGKINCAEQALQITTTHAQTVMQTISAIRSKYGGAYNYFEAKCGFKKDDVNNLMDFLLEIK